MDSEYYLDKERDDFYERLDLITRDYRKLVATEMTFSDQRRAPNDGGWEYRTITEASTRVSKIIEAFKSSKTTLISTVNQTFACTVEDKVNLMKNSSSFNLLFVWPGTYESHAFKVSEGAVFHLLEALDELPKLDKEIKETALKYGQLLEKRKETALKYSQLLEKRNRLSTNPKANQSYRRTVNEDNSDRWRI